MVYFDSELETARPEAIAEHQRHKLDALLAELVRGNAFYQRKFDGLDAAGGGVSLAGLPLTTRAELEADHQAAPPYGTNLTYDRSRYTRCHQTSGSAGAPLRWLDTPESWDWWKRCWGVIYRAAGLRDDDRLVFPFSFGPFVGFWGAFESAAALGNFCLPAGGMTTQSRLAYLLDHEVTIVCCTPTYALRMAEVAGEMGLDLASSAVRGLIVAGEPGGNIPATRSRIESAWGARVFDHAGMTEMGPWGFECVEAPGGMHVMEHEFIAEAIDPATGTVVGDGESGELVLTNLGRVGSPLIRYRTGDQVRLTRGECACGRWFARVEGGILGRYDDMVVIRGNNVFPAAVEAIVRAFPEIVEFQMEVHEVASMTELHLRIEAGDGVAASDLVDRVATHVQDRLHFRPTVSAAPPGSLPRFDMKARRLVRKDRH